jgi:hypothetical protein
MAAPEADNCIFNVRRATESLLKYPDKANKGFVALGSFDENWGWLRYEVK